MSTLSEGIRIESVLAGAAVPFGPGGEPSAIRKTALRESVGVGPDGLEGDGHGDTVHHGGADKAVHHYAFDHYRLWATELPEAAEHFGEPGFFGENISTFGLTEADVCVGDTFRAGTALLQVSEVRQPCWKLSHRCGVPGFSRRVQDTGRTGWYYRVLEPGTLGAGDLMVLRDRPRPQWPLARLLRIFYHSVLDREELRGMAELPELAAGQRQLALRRLETGEVEPWDGRLNGIST